MIRSSPNTAYIYEKGQEISESVGVNVGGGKKEVVRIVAKLGEEEAQAGHVGPPSFDVDRFQVNC